MESPSGDIWRQIDYIAISEEQKNWINIVRNHGPANTNQENQHRIIEARMQIRYKQREDNANQHIKCNLGRLQEGPEKLADIVKETDINTICNGGKERNYKERWERLARYLRMKSNRYTPR